MARSPLTIRRMMLEIAFLGLLMAPSGCAARLARTPSDAAILWLVASAWALVLLILRRAYRDFRNPFG